MHLTNLLCMYADLFQYNLSLYSPIDCLKVIAVFKFFFGIVPKYLQLHQEPGVEFF